MEGLSVARIEVGLRGGWAGTCKKGQDEQGRNQKESSHLFMV